MVRGEESADVSFIAFSLSVNPWAASRFSVSIDRIAQHKDLRLVALFAPEHGIRGNAPAGQRIVDEKDPRTGVPVYSL